MFKKGDVIRGTISSNKDSYGLYDVSIGGPFPFRRVPASRPRHQYFAGMQVLLGFLNTDCPVIISPGYSQSGWPLPTEPVIYLATVIRPEYNFGRSNYLELPEGYDTSALITGTGEQAWQYDEGESMGLSVFDTGAGYIYTNKHKYQIDSNGDKTTLATYDISGETGYSTIFPGLSPSGTQYLQYSGELIRQTTYTLDYDAESISANDALDASTPSKEGYNYSSGGHLFIGNSSYYGNELTPTSRSMLALNYTASGNYAFTDIYRQAWGSRQYLATLNLYGFPTFDDAISGGTVSVINEDGDVVRLCHWITGESFTHESYGESYPVNIGYLDAEGALHTITSGVRPTALTIPTPNFRSLRFLGNKPRYLKADFSGNYGIILDAPTNTPSAVSYAASMLDTHATNNSVADDTAEYKVTAISGAIRIQKYTSLMAADGDPVDVDVSEYIANTFTIARPVIDSAGRIVTAYHDATAKRRGVIVLDLEEEAVVFHYESPKQSDNTTSLEYRYYGSLIAMVEQDSSVSPVTYRAVMIRAAAE